MLLHVPERLDVLDRLVAALAPGGWLLIEDFDTSEQRVADPEGPNTPLVTKVLAGFRELLRQRGAVSCFAAGALRHLLERGLSETGASGYVAIGGGGSAMAGVLKANALQVREGLLTVGITPAEFDAYLAALDNPHVIIGSPVLISAWGRRS